MLKLKSTEQTWKSFAEFSDVVLFSCFQSYWHLEIAWREKNKSSKTNEQYFENRDQNRKGNGNVHSVRLKKKARYVCLHSHLFIDMLPSQLSILFLDGTTNWLISSPFKIFVREKKCFPFLRGKVFSRNDSIEKFPLFTLKI